MPALALCELCEPPDGPAPKGGPHPVGRRDQLTMTWVTVKPSVDCARLVTLQL
jgi:hypothetical protein